jgi:hypothetical protein
MFVLAVMNVDISIKVVEKFLGRRAESDTDATEIGGSKDRVASRSLDPPASP